MFSFEATPVMFVGLLALFAWCLAWGVVELWRSGGVEQRVSNGLHVLMSAVMLAMVPRASWVALRDAVGMPVLVAAFVAATGWFAWLAASPAPGVHGRRGHFVGHAVMFGAMAWHLVGMAAMQAATLVAWVGLPFMAALLAMGARHLVAASAPAASGELVAAACTEPRPAGSPAARAHDAAGAAMNLGMFWMSVGLLTPVLPALALLRV